MRIRGIFDNIEIKLICLLLAIIMWFYAGKPTEQVSVGIDRIVSAISRDDKAAITFHRVPLRLVGLQREWQAEPAQVSIQARCLRAEIETGSFRAVINLTMRDEEETQVTLTVDNVVLPKGLAFVKAEPNEIKITPAP